MADRIHGTGNPGSEGATVVAMHDGDSVELQGNGQLVTMRLASINEPELRQRTQRALAVQVRRFSTDRYARLVAERGAAFVYLASIRGCDRQSYGRLETQARRKCLGVSAVPGGLERPWELRARSRR